MSLTRAWSLWAILACCFMHAGAAEIAPFQLTDISGAAINSADWKTEKAIVICVIGTECPIAKLYAPRLQQLSEKYAAKGIAFLAIAPNQQDSLAELQAFAKTNALRIPLAKDLGNKTADALGAERTPEVFVLNQKREIIYRGRIDDQYTYGRQRPKVEREYLVEAIEAVLAERAPEIAKTEAVGCLIGRVLKPDESSGVTYSNQISRIFQKHCVECHRAGEVAPFALTSYEEAVGWAEMIKEVVSLERMPPWHADPKHGKFANDPRLTLDEKELISAWVAAGAPQGDRKQEPPPRTFPTDWRIGKPDAVIYMSDKPYAVPASGVVRYQFFTVDPGFSEDRWVQAAECRPGDPSVVHHIIVGIIPPNGSKKNQGALHSEWLTATAPGARPMQLGEGYAKFIPAGSKLVFQMHYTPNGKATQDRSCVALKFLDAKLVKKQVGTEKSANARFVIPPGAANHAVDATHRFEKDALLLRMFPHMHLRGKAFRYTALYPDGKREVLLDVPHYDFNWQDTYELAEPKFMPAGTRMYCEAVFDNSAENLANPNPKQSVRWGDQTWDEMMIGYFDMALADQDRTVVKTDRTAAFKKSLPKKPSDDLKARAAKAFDSPEQWMAFALELRREVPQLDRLDWMTLAGERMTIRLVAEEPATAKKLAQAQAGKSLDASLSKISGHLSRGRAVAIDRLDQETSFDLVYMAKTFDSSLHIPLTRDAEKGIVNCWSFEAEAFPAEAIAFLGELFGAAQ